MSILWSILLRIYLQRIFTRNSEPSSLIIYAAIKKVYKNKKIIYNKFRIMKKILFKIRKEGLDGNERTKKNIRDKSTDN